MKLSKNKLIAIVGPTASGKSDLAIVLAKQYHTDVVSIDSRQVYKKMDLGSAKVPGKLCKKCKIKIKLAGKNKFIYPYESALVKHWMIDIADPIKEHYSLAHFQDVAYQIIFSLFSMGKVPILCGGSALYMDAILKGFQIPKTSLKIRKELERFPTNELLQELKKIDPISYQKIDKKNRRRIIRAVESFLVNQQSHLQYKNKKPNFKYLIIGINRPRDILYERIDNRVDTRIDDGMIEEVRKLHQLGLSYKKLYDFGLEYRYCALYLQGKISRTQMTRDLKYKIHAFVRRQYTWWRRNHNIVWFDAQDSKFYLNIKNIVNKFLNKG